MVTLIFSAAATFIDGKCDLHTTRVDMAAVLAPAPHLYLERLCLAADAAAPKQVRISQ